MSESQRGSRSRARSDRSDGGSRASAEPAPAAASHAPAWAAPHLGTPTGLGVQRRVTIGEAGDRYEREADRVAADVVSGRSIGPAAISALGPLPAPSVGQRAAAPDDKKKEEKPEAPAVQKAAAPE